MDYPSYFLADRCQHQDDDVAKHIAQLAKRLKVQLKSQMFDRFDLIPIFSFLLAFQMTRDTNDIHEGVVMWLFHIFMKEPAGAALSASTCLTSSRWSHQDGKLISYIQVRNYLLNT